MKRTLRLAAALTILAATLCSTGVAEGAPLTLHLKFQQRGVAKSVMTNGRYVLMEAPSGAPTLIDEQTGKRVNLPECANNALGFVAPYLEWHNCANPNPNESGFFQGALVLYTLRTGVITTIGSDQTCDLLEEPCAVNGPAGTDWYATTYIDRCDCTPGDLNGLHGRSYDGPFPPGPRELIDYDSANLAHKLCSPLPLSVKMGRRATSETADWFFGGDYGFEGSGIAPGPLPVDVYQNSGAWLGGFVIAYDERGDPFLEHCGTRLTRRLSTSVFTGNVSALILLGNAPAGRSELHGIFLPSLRRFTIPLPAQLQAARTQFVLSRRTLWGVTPDGTAWTARAPAQRYSRDSPSSSRARSA